MEPTISPTIAPSMDYSLYRGGFSDTYLWTIGSMYPALWLLAMSAFPKADPQSPRNLPISQSAYGQKRSFRAANLAVLVGSENVFPAYLREDHFRATLSLPSFVLGYCPRTSACILAVRSRCPSSKACARRWWAYNFPGECNCGAT